MDASGNALAIWSEDLPGPIATTALACLSEEPGALLLLYNRSGHIAFVSRSLCRWSGTPASEWLGKQAEEVWPAPLARQDLQEMQQMSSGERTVREEERPTRNGIRKVRTTRVALDESRESHRWRVGLLVQLEDLHDKEEQRQRFHQARKMETVGRLAGGIVHDFNNILMVLGGLLDQLRAEGFARVGQSATLSSMQNTLDQGAELTGQLLSYLRGEPQSFRPIDLNALIRGIGRFLRSAVGRRIHLEFQLAASLPSVLGDSVQLTQALINLCINARDAMPEGGTLRILTDTIEISPDEAATAHCRPGTHVRVRVEDNGSGMSPEVQARIFEPLFTTREQGRGTGLGLTVVSEAVDQHSGAIQCQSTLGEGTCFTLLLPASAPAGWAPPAPPSALILDRNPNIAPLLRLILEQAGYQVHLTEGPNEVLGYLINQQPDVLILEVRELLQPAVQESLHRAPHLPILLLGDVITHLPEGRPYAFLPKPFDPRGLLQALEHLLPGGVQKT
jgi:PAS domain S-box-containing protein